MTVTEIDGDPSGVQPGLEEKTKRSWLGVRHLITLLLFLGTTVGYAMRVNLSIAMVAMVDNEDNPDFEEFDWDSSRQNIILSSFFWGYVVTQVPSGLLAQSYGAKWLLLSGLAISSICTILTPVVASAGGWGAVCALRVIEGLSQATLFPSLHSVMSKWAPPDERGRLVSICFSGSQVGTIIAFPLGGFLASSGGGWPSIFYVIGGVGFVWCILWFFLAASSPAEHSFISQEEKSYIETSLFQTEKPVRLTTPWIALLKSAPMWAILLAHSAQNWGFWILMTEMPTYMKQVLGFDIKANGLFSALPYLTMAILSYVFGYIADFILRRGYVTLVWSRKIFNSIGFWGPAIALIILGYIDKSEIVLGVVLLVLSVGLNAGVYVGFQVNHIDLSPNFAGTMMGITNGFSNIFSIIGPLVVGAVVTEEGSTSQWRIVFLASAAVYTVGNILFLFLAQANIQPWDNPNYSEGKWFNSKSTDKVKTVNPA